MTKTSVTCAVRPLANAFTALFESPEPDRVFAYSPGIVRLGSERLVATIDLGGPGVAELSGALYERGELGWSWQGQVYTSDDGGASWTHRFSFPFMHARPFVAGKAVYVLGQAGDLMIIRSDDEGQTWSSPVRLSEGQYWHQAPCNVHDANDCIYLVMERRVTHDVSGWYVGEVAPVLMRGRCDDDLTQQENWTFASELSFRDVLPGWETDPGIDYFGVPFFRGPFPRGEHYAGRHMNPIGWLETNVVQFHDPGHLWHDPNGKTLHLWSRAHTGGVGYACIAKVVEQGEQPGTGEMITDLQKAPSGKTMLYVPCPGGQMKFHILFDGQTQRYWLLSTQATDSMRRPEHLPPDRYNLPNNERRRLQLHVSRNMVDWCFAGLVASGPVEKASRHYAAMAIDGDDLVVLSRSGDERAKSPHDGNLITFHRISDFRALVY